MEKKIFMYVLVLEVIIIASVMSFYSSFANAGVGQNVTVITQLNIGNVWPEVFNVSFNEGEDISLIANATKLVSCTAEIRDYNGEADIKNISGVIFHSTNSSFGAPDFGLNHYTNLSCGKDLTFGDEYTLMANCTFYVQYYAMPGEWNCTITVNDTYDWSASESNVSNVLELLAVGLPTTINYGTVNATFVSQENVTEVANLGNIKLNLSLSGYARTEGDNLAMNCTVGNIGEIPIYYEKYNLSATTPGDLTLSQFESSYINLTSSPVVKEFNLGSKVDDSPDYSIKNSFWRIYVPRGVAGTCSGNIIFGAVQANEV
jgi:hypothetical protein